MFPTPSCKYNVALVARLYRHIYTHPKLYTIYVRRARNLNGGSMRP